MNKDTLSVSNSILAGAVIIALAVFFSRGSSIPPKPLETGDSQAAAALVTVTDRSDAPREGDGKVVITEFSDFQCPYCKSFWTETYPQIKAKYIDTGKVTLVYRHYPLSIHQNAEKAAEASECANDQGKFWQYHDTLFAASESNGSGLDILSLKKYAADLGLNTTDFNACLDSGEKATVVAADMSAGSEAGVTGTPTFVINGREVIGALPFSYFEPIIEAALK